MAVGFIMWWCWLDCGFYCVVVVLGGCTDGGLMSVVVDWCGWVVICHHIWINVDHGGSRVVDRCGGLWVMVAWWVWD